MINPPSAENPTPSQPAPAEPGLEATAQAFWEKNRTLIFAVIGVILLAIVVREGWQHFQKQHDLGVRADYAKLADRPEQLTAFAAANGDHPLAGVAYLRVADAKYAGGDFRAALDNYKKAANTLKNPALLGRARLGQAVSQIGAGDKSAGEAAFKAIGADATLAQSVRAEAYYHLATLAKENGNTAEISRLVGEINKLDPASVWAQRGGTLLANP